MSLCNWWNKIIEELLTSLLTFPLSWNHLGQLLWLIMEKVKTFNHKKNLMPRLLIDFLWCQMSNEKLLIWNYGVIYNIKMCVSSGLQCFTMESQRQNFICDKKELFFINLQTLHYCYLCEWSQAFLHHWFLTCSINICSLYRVEQINH